MPGPSNIQHTSRPPSIHELSSMQSTSAVTQVSGGETSTAVSAARQGAVSPETHEAVVRAHTPPPGSISRRASPEVQDQLQHEMHTRLLQLQELKELQAEHLRNGTDTPELNRQVVQQTIRFEADAMLLAQSRFPDETIHYSHIRDVVTEANERFGGADEFQYTPLFTHAFTGHQNGPIDELANYFDAAYQAQEQLTEHYQNHPEEATPENLVALSLSMILLRNSAAFEMELHPDDTKLAHANNRINHQLIYGPLQEAHESKTWGTAAGAGAHGFIQQFFASYVHLGSTAAGTKHEVTGTETYANASTGAGVVMRGVAEGMVTGLVHAVFTEGVRPWIAKGSEHLGMKPVVPVATQEGEYGLTKLQELLPDPPTVKVENWKPREATDAEIASDKEEVQAWKDYFVAVSSRTKLGSSTGNATAIEIFALAHSFRELAELGHQQEFALFSATGGGIFNALHNLYQHRQTVTLPKGTVPTHLPSTKVTTAAAAFANLKNIDPATPEGRKELMKRLLAMTIGKTIAAAGEAYVVESIPLEMRGGDTLRKLTQAHVNSWGNLGSWFSTITPVQGAETKKAIKQGLVTADDPFKDTKVAFHGLMNPTSAKHTPFDTVPIDSPVRKGQGIPTQTAAALRRGADVAANAGKHALALAPAAIAEGVEAAGQATVSGITKGVQKLRTREQDPQSQSEV